MSLVYYMLLSCEDVKVRLLFTSWCVVIKTKRTRSVHIEISYDVGDFSRFYELQKTIWQKRLKNYTCLKSHINEIFVYFKILTKTKWITNY